MIGIEKTTLESSAMTKIILGSPVGKNHQIDIRSAGYCYLEAQAPNVTWRYSSTRSAGSSRSQIVYEAIKDAEVTHVYTVDSDTIPPTGTLDRLLKYNVPIVAGIYPVYLEQGLCWSFAVGKEWWSIDKSLPEGLIEATIICGSTVLIKREVFLKLEFPWFHDVIQFDDSGNDISYGEDVYFSDHAREAGFKLMVDPKIVCDHYNYASLLNFGSNYEMVYDRGVKL